jgi:signal transduction histidine kinase
MARDLGRVMEIVRLTARELTGADGATFVLRDGPFCHYAEEDAIAPLWKGKRFPLENCISGWVMQHAEAVAIPDIYTDARIPTEAYRPTFVKSMAMVPIRRAAPIGAIGNYWARTHQPTAGELNLLQALADSTSVAMENIQVYSELEKRVQTRTAELEVANRELETFSYTVSHDLRAPVRAIEGYAELLQEPNVEPADTRRYLERIGYSVRRMNSLIDETLKLARISSATLSRIRTDLSRIATEIALTVRTSEPARKVRFNIASDVFAEGDPELLRIALENLIGNAWKFTARTADAEIEFGRVQRGAGYEFYVRDNGAGFDPAKAARLFEPFQRFHAATEFPGNGVGLATVRRIVARHGGSIRAESSPSHGASFYFTLP